MNYPKSLENLIRAIEKFPGIGRRSAERIALYIMNASKEEVSALSQALFKVKDSVRFCKVCNNLSDTETCTVCQDSQRDRAIICVVEDPNDIAAIEKTKSFNGLYHVLMGSIAPLEGRGPDDLKIKELLQRIKDERTKEVIIATDSDTEGETTALYLSRLIKQNGVRLSRIGMGLPLGHNLEYTDCATLAKALESRRPI